MGKWGSWEYQSLPGRPGRCDMQLWALGNLAVLGGGKWGSAMFPRPLMVPAPLGPLRSGKSRPRPWETVLLPSQPPNFSLALEYTPYRTQTGKEDVSPSWVLPKETSPTLAHWMLCEKPVWTKLNICWIPMTSEHCTSFFFFYSSNIKHKGIWSKGLDSPLNIHRLDLTFRLATFISDLLFFKQHLCFRSIDITFLISFKFLLKDASLFG